MFTGLVVELGTVEALKLSSSGAKLAVSAPGVTKGIALGGSVAVSGACLTVTAINGQTMEFDISTETLRSTSLGGLRPGDRVNLEPAVRAQDPLGGHIVSGHVDVVGSIRSKSKAGDAWKVEIKAPAGFVGLLVNKGSVTVDGISLTVVDLLENAFTVVIIPHTARNTTIGFKEPPAPVNLEADIIGKYVARFLEKMAAGQKKAGITMESLRDSGFIS
ncbi:MAG: riboflavin synthase [Nitrospiraceae bacterium]|nr:riboflavin synthase [Nitrospiraceae bacterium]